MNNGLYSIHVTLLDGRSGKGSGVILFRDGQILGGDAYLFYTGSYTVKGESFKGEVLGRETIGNVELILDVNHQNNRPAFDETLMQAKAQDGRFRGVTRFSRIDSSASRLLQLADLVAYSRKWIVSAEMNAKGLKDRFGIQMP